MAVLIDDPDDQRVADFRRLNDTAYRRQVEAAGPFHRGTLVAEGWLAVERLLPSRYQVRAVLADAAKVDRAAELIGRRDVPVFLADRAVLDAIVGFPLHRGVVASASRALPGVASNVIARSRALVVAEGVNDAENMGALVRNAAALGADGLLMDPTACDPLTRRAIRVSVGLVFSLPFARLAWPDGLTLLRESGVTTVALTTGPRALDIAELGVPRDRRVAIVVGAEGPGLSEEAIAACDVRTRIPMSLGVDSLNVAAAAAIAMHRLFRP